MAFSPQRQKHKGTRNAECLSEAKLGTISPHILSDRAGHILFENQGHKVVQEWGDSSSLVRRIANDMAKRVVTGKGKGMGLPTHSTYCKDFPRNVLNESV